MLREKEERILVVGGCGFIGSNIVRDLVSKGFKVKVLDKNIQVNNDIEVEYIKGKVSEQDILEKAMTDVNKIIYLKSGIVPSISKNDSIKIYEEEISDAIKLCELSIKNGIKRIVFSSSGGTVYGNIKEKTPIKENQELYPINDYGILKVTIEKIFNMYNETHGMDNIILRIANPYGMGQDIKSGVGAITAFIKSMKKEEVLKIFGDGNVIRDYIYISDVVNAFYKALCVDTLSGIRPIFNIGTGVGLSLNEVIEILSIELNLIPKVQYMESRKFDVLYNVLDIQKAKLYLDWKPKLSFKEYVHKYVEIV